MGSCKYSQKHYCMSRQVYKDIFPRDEILFINFFFNLIFLITPNINCNEAGLYLRIFPGHTSALVHNQPRETKNDTECFSQNV